MRNENYLLDTNIFILLFNDRLACELPTENLASSIITEMELLSFPELDPNEEKIIRSYLKLLHIHNIDNEVKNETIHLRREYRLALPDAIIASTAITKNSILLTNDQDFEDVKNLECKSLPLKNQD